VLADSISLGIVHSGHVLRRNDLDTTHFCGEGVSGQSDLATIVSAIPKHLVSTRV
jgi:hypothetical protein